MNIQETLIQFIKNKLVLDREEAKIEADEPIFGGLLDSLDILRLVVFIEEQFNVRVQDEDVVPENFETVQNIAEFIERKLAASA